MAIPGAVNLTEVGGPVPHSIVLFHIWILYRKLPKINSELRLGRVTESVTTVQKGSEAHNLLQKVNPQVRRISKRSQLPVHLEGMSDSEFNIQPVSFRSKNRTPPLEAIRL